MTDVERCPVCGAAAGRYRDGACGPGCDQVLGTPSEDDAAILIVCLAILVVVVVAVLVARLL